jgi:ribonucleoside-diphosphate reductase alpha chain
VADTITAWGVKDGYFADDAEAEAFNAELKYLDHHAAGRLQLAVWFNIGVADVPQQAARASSSRSTTP